MDDYSLQNKMMEYEIEKRKWTEDDFENMGWHDSSIYKIRLTQDLEMDIDYILKWNQPEIEGMFFTFWVAPATLVFGKIHGLSFELDFFTDSTILEIDSIERNANGKVYDWIIITQQGDIQFTSDGYEQYIRQEPFFEFGQTISYIDRNGYSLERTIEQENLNRNREDAVARRQKDLDDYENFKKRHVVKQELELLLKAKENNEIDTKQYLLKKREMTEHIFSYTFFLKGTRFEDW